MFPEEILEIQMFDLLSVKIRFNLFYSHNFIAARVYIEPQILWI